MRIRQIGVAAGRECAQQIERRRRLAIGLQLPARIGRARFARELGAIDDVAAIDRQLDAIALFDRRGARLGELAGDAADLHHRAGRGIGQHHRHLQEQAEEIADIIGAVLGEAFGAVAALQQESIAGGHLRQRLFQIARFAGKDQRREGRKLRLDIGKRLRIGIIRHLHDRLAAPGIPGSISTYWTASTSRISNFRHPKVRPCGPMTSGAASGSRLKDDGERLAVLYTPRLRGDSPGKPGKSAYSAASRA